MVDLRQGFNLCSQANKRVQKPSKEYPNPTLSGLLRLYSIRYARRGILVRRLFSTFARGWPGAGLLFMRIITGVALIAQALTSLRTEPRLGVTISDAVAMVAGILLLAGLWTPIAGMVVAILSFWNAFSPPGDRLSAILLGTLGAAVALVGPGAWSVDARLFGWKRIDVRDRGDRDTPQ